MTARTTRRTALGRGGAAVLALPFYKMLEGSARAQTAPRRVLFFATPNGAHIPTFYPTDWAAFSPSLRPLDPLKRKVMVLSGVDMKSALDFSKGRPRNHAWHNPNALIARQPSAPAPPAYGPPAGISLDQEIANTIGTPTRLKSLSLGVQTSAHSGFYLQATAAGQILFPENSPEKVYGQHFANLMATPGPAPGPSPVAVKLLAERKSVLDFVNADLTRLKCALGGEERPRLDAHVNALRDLERSLAFTPTATGPGCRKPDLPAGSDFRAIGKKQMDIAVRALACDLTRVITLQWSNGASQIAHAWAGVNFGHHSIAHRGLGDTGRLTEADAVALITKIEAWYAEQFFYLCSQLDQITDVDGRTLLDNTAVVWIHEQADGPGHAAQDMPYVIAGSCGGRLKLGRAVRFTGMAHNNVLLTVAHAVGARLATFGDPRFSTGPIADLMA